LCFPALWSSLSSRSQLWDGDAFTVTYQGLPKLFHVGTGLEGIYPLFRVSSTGIFCFLTTNLFPSCFLEHGKASSAAYVCAYSNLFVMDTRWASLTLFSPFARRSVRSLAPTCFISTWKSTTTGVSSESSNNQQNACPGLRASDIVDYSASCRATLALACSSSSRQSGPSEERPPARTSKNLRRAPAGPARGSPALRCSGINSTSHGGNGPKRISCTKGSLLVKYRAGMGVGRDRWSPCSLCFWLKLRSLKVCYLFVISTQPP